MSYIDKKELLVYLQHWLAKHGEPNATIIQGKDSLKAEVRGGIIICNTDTRALSYVFKDIVLDGGAYHTETSVCSYGTLPVGQSAGPITQGVGAVA